MASVACSEEPIASAATFALVIAWAIFADVIASEAISEAPLASVASSEAPIVSAATSAALIALSANAALVIAFFKTFNPNIYAAGFSERDLIGNYLNRIDDIHYVVN